MSHPSYRVVKRLVACFVFLVLPWSTDSHPQESARLQAQEPWRYVEAVDGDTVRLQRAEGVRTVHLFGIDAPELGQDGGAEAKGFIEELIRGKEIGLVIRQKHGDDLVGIITVDGRDLGEILCESGYAWISEEGDTKECYALLVVTARASKRGIWSDEDAEHPAEWRRRRPQPTPVRKAQTLADIASDVELKSSVIDNIPSINAKTEEARRFLNRAISLASSARLFEGMKAEHQLNCSGSSDDDTAFGGEGTVWSEEAHAWVSAAETVKELITKDCKQVEAKYIAGFETVKNGLRKAREEARHFGVPESFIREVVAKLELDKY